MDARIEEGGLIQSIVDQYFRCARTEHYSDFNPEKKRQLRSELERLGAELNFSAMTWKTEDGLHGSIQDPLASIEHLQRYEKEAWADGDLNSALKFQKRRLALATPESEARPTSTTTGSQGEDVEAIPKAQTKSSRRIRAMLHDLATTCADDEMMDEESIRAELREAPDCAYVSGSNDVGARLRAAVEANRDHYIAEGCGLFDVEDGCCYESHSLQMSARTRAILQIQCAQGEIPEGIFNMSTASSDPESDSLPNSPT